MQWNWILHTQGPDEPVYIARLDDDYKTRAELMEHGFLLAAAPDLFVQTVRFSECLESMLRGECAPALNDLEVLAKEARAAIAKAKGTPCDHNEMIANYEPGYAWTCARCGHVYGKED